METKYIAGILTFIVLAGGAIYLQLPIEEPTKDLCTKDGISGIWENVTEIEYYNSTYPAIAQYYCKPEDSTQWCYKLSSTEKTCYLLYEMPEPIEPEPPKPKTGISFQSRSWTVSDNCYNYNENYEVIPDTSDEIPYIVLCDEDIYGKTGGIEDYLNFRYIEITDKKWKFFVTPKPEFFNHYKENDLKNYEVANVSKKLKITTAIYDSNDKELEVEIEFEDEFKGGEKLKFGKESTTYVSSKCGIITVQANSTKGNTNTPFTFQDIVDVDEANTTWNCSTGLNNTAYEFTCCIDVTGDSTRETFFNDSEKIVVFTDMNFSSSYERPIFRTLTNATVTLGKIINVAAKSTTDGVAIITKEDDNNYNGVAFNKCFLYSFTYLSTSTTVDRSSCANGNQWHSILSGSTFGLTWTPNTVDMTDVYFTAGFEGISGPVGSTMDRVTVKSTSYLRAISTTPPNFTFTNFYIRAMTYWLLDTRKSSYIVDTDSNTWTISWFSTSTQKSYRQYSMNVKIIDTDNNPLDDVEFNITSTTGDSDCTLDLYMTTNASGVNDTKIITKEWYNYTLGASDCGTNCYKKDCNPHRFVITKSGYQTLNFTANITTKTDWTIAMLGDVAPYIYDDYIYIPGDV